MKKIMKSILVFAIVFATLSGNATEIISFKNNEDGKIVLTLDNVNEGQQLLIKDVNGLTLYKERIKKSGEYSRGFDLTALPEGHYYFELNKDTTIEIIPFIVNQSKVSFDKADKKTIYKPFVRKKDNLIIITCLSLSKEVLKVELFYDNDGVDYDLLYTETFENTLDVQRVYALDKTKKGSYKIIITKEDRTFINTIKQ